MIKISKQKIPIGELNKMHAAKIAIQIGKNIVNVVESQKEIEKQKQHEQLNLLKKHMRKYK